MGAKSIFVVLTIADNEAVDAYREWRVNPNFIVSIQLTESGTIVMPSSGNGEYVRETPDQIEELIKQAATTAIEIAQQMATELVDELDLEA